MAVCDSWTMSHMSRRRSMPVLTVSFMHWRLIDLAHSGAPQLEGVKLMFDQCSCGQQQLRPEVLITALGEAH